MFISVVIPTYRRPDLLSRCVQALASQNYDRTHYEVIVVSDGPDDETDRVIQQLREFHPRLTLRYYETPGRSGPATARNMGWRQAIGDLVAFTDDDCIPSASWLRDFSKSYVTFGKELVSFSGKVVVPISDEPTDYEKNIAHLETADFITANCACSKKALELTEGFDEDFQTAWREDSALEFELIELGIPIFKLNGAVVTHPVRHARWGVSIQEQKKSMFNALLFKKYPVLYKRKISKSPVWDYYFMIVLSFLSILFFLFHLFAPGLLTAAVWLFLMVKFITRRLKDTRLTVHHISEMIFTSVIIPYLSVYWTIRGAIRYKVFFL